METSRQPKSILKRNTSASDKYKTIEERNREVALYHANLIQLRKDIELEILFSLEALIDFPLSPALSSSSSSQRSPSPASNPSSSDAAAFKTHLAHFTPSDFDALIEERNINEKCGYALCPNPRKKETGGGAFRILGMGGRAKDFRVVKRETLEMWCGEGKGEACKKRAMWVRVQLEECPAWERAPDGRGGGIELLDEPKREENVIMEGIESLALGDEAENKEKGRRDLALERGERGMGMGAQKGLVDVKVLEKEVSASEVKGPSFGEELSGRLEHLALEGYTSRFEGQQRKMVEMARNQNEMDEDGPDTDWNL